MEARIIEFVIGITLLLIFFKGVLPPLLEWWYPWLKSFIKSILPIFDKSQLEKQKEALKQSEERIRIAEIQKETILNERKAMRIQDSIIYEEFEELDEKYEVSKSKHNVGR